MEEGIFALILGAAFFWVLWYVLILVSRWLIFAKAGIAGWKAFIPVYSDYCTFRIAWNRGKFWQFAILTLASAILSGMVTNLTDAGDAVPALLSAAVSILGIILTVMHLMLNIKLSGRYGHGILFGLGLAFLTPLFTMILGLGSSRYLGNPQEGLRGTVY